VPKKAYASVIGKYLKNFLYGMKRIRKHNYVCLNVKAVLATHFFLFLFCFDFIDLNMILYGYFQKRERQED
jgi:hypothetical protein